jgi:predicted dienelactone hydrolase
MQSIDNRIDLIRPDAPVLAAIGPHAVGVRTLEMVNPGQMDVMAALAGSPRLSDRRLVVELWYPARPGTGRVEPYPTLLRDGRTPVALYGSAAREAEAVAGEFPLVVISHGYPGNRMLMSHLGENLASKGYLVAAIDHADSTYGDAAYLGGEAFGSTLVNRPLDTSFVMTALGAKAAAIVGYSMGGYGALVSGGAAVARAALTLERAGAVAQHWERHCDARADPRLKAIVAIGPWGRQMGLWDSVGMAGLSVPALIIAGSADAISGYENGMRLIFDEARATERHLLTFQNAGHNAAAPIPAPLESWRPSPHLDFVPFEHYADPVWDNVRMNNIAQHFVTAFLGVHLKGETDGAPYLDGRFAGFAEGTARGLCWETAAQDRCA